MNNVPGNEQWKLGGDCSKCRRQKYCSTPCTRTKRVIRAEMQSLTTQAMDRMTGGAYSEIMERSPYRY